MSGISNQIPGTNYSIRGDQFIDKDGTTLTKDEFVDKVSKKEITLTGDSLTFLDSRLGPDTMSSLRTGTGFSTSPQELNGKLENSSTEQLTSDLFSLMQVLARVTQEQKKVMTDVKHNESDMQISLMEKSAQRELEAGNWKVAIGIMQGIFTICSGAAGIKGGLGGTEATMSMGAGAGKVFEGIGGLLAAGGQFIVNDLEKQGKDLNTQSKKMEEMQGETKDQLDGLREMHAKVKELLQSIQQAESQTARNVSSM
jgi:hypothetical protein